MMNSSSTYKEGGDQNVRMVRIRCKNIAAQEISIFSFRAHGFGNGGNYFKRAAFQQALALRGEAEDAYI